MASSGDQTALMMEILATLQKLQVDQTQLASNVDAISGRVNVLAGMKEVRELAAAQSPISGSASESTPAKQMEIITNLDGPPQHEETKIPESPSLPAVQLAQVSQARAPSSGSSSRIILT